MRHVFHAIALLALSCLTSTVAAGSEAATAATGSAATSRFTTSVLSGSASVPRLWLAQRAIDRDWGPSDDSTYRTVDVKGWKADGLALALSGAVPGAGQLYVGEGSGWLYLAGEAAGWVGRAITRRRGVSLRDDAATFVGNPTDSLSAWSFARYSFVTGGDAALLEKLWTRDRDAFYQALANDATYLPGFAGNDPTVTSDSYRTLREASQDRFRQSRYFEIALLLNHAVAAFDALRAARIHDLPLRRNVDLRVDGRWHRGEPQLRAALVGRF